MTQHDWNASQQAHPGVLPGEIDRWRQAVHDVPDVRLPKVLAMRRAVQSDHLDSDAVWGETIRRLGNEVGVLCREDRRETTQDGSTTENG